MTLRWQIVDMHAAGMSFKAIGRQLGYSNSVTSRLVRKHQATNDVKDRPRPGQPRKTTLKDDRGLARLSRRVPFATSGVLKRLWLPNRRLSNITVSKHLACDPEGSSSVQRCLITIKGDVGVVYNSTASELSDLEKSPLVRREQFLLLVTDGRMRVWRHKNTASCPGTSDLLFLVVEDRLWSGDASRMIANCLW